MEKNDKLKTAMAEYGFKVNKNARSDFEGAWVRYIKTNYDDCSYDGEVYVYKYRAGVVPDGDEIEVIYRGIDFIYPENGECKYEDWYKSVDQYLSKDQYLKAIDNIKK